MAFRPSAIDANGRPLFAFRRGPPRARNKPLQHPEDDLQVQVVQYLMMALPDASGWLWSADLAGIRLSAFVASKLKTRGVRRGWGDLRFIGPDHITRYIELKSPIGRPRPDQLIFAGVAGPNYTICRSIVEVKEALERWGAPLRTNIKPQAGSRYG